MLSLFLSPLHISFWYVFFILELDEIEPNSFLSPFLDVIRSEDTTGPITGLALTSVNKFLSYGLVGKFFNSMHAHVITILDVKKKPSLRKLMVNKTVTGTCI